MDIETEPTKPVPHIVGALSMINGTTSNLTLAMARRLLWADHTNIANDGIPGQSALSPIISDLVDTLRTQFTLDEAVERQLNSQDYRLVEIMISGISQEARDKYETIGKRVKQDSQATLDNHISTMRGKVNQAARDGTIEIDDQYWIGYCKTLEAIASQAEVLNYRELFAELEELERDLEKQSDKRYTALCDEWSSVLVNREDTDSRGLPDWTVKFELAKENKDIRVMEECLMRLRIGSALEVHHEREPLDDLYEDAQNSLTGFISFTEDIQDIERYARSSDGLRALQSRLSMIEEKG